MSPPQVVFVELRPVVVAPPADGSAPTLSVVVDDPAQVGTAEFDQRVREAVRASAMGFCSRVLGPVRAAVIAAVPGAEDAWTRRVAGIARVCHEANRALQAELGEDPSPHWDDAPAWQRLSSMEGVERALAGATPEQLHESWCEARRRDGWVHGEVKDAEAKTHPCLVPYADLPPDQRLKDQLFAFVVDALRP